MCMHAMGVTVLLFHNSRAAIIKRPSWRVWLLRQISVARYSQTHLEQSKSVIIIDLEWEWESFCFSSFFLLFSSGKKSFKTSSLWWPSKKVVKRWKTLSLTSWWIRPWNLMWGLLLRLFTRKSSSSFPPNSTLTGDIILLLKSKKSVVVNSLSAGICFDY